VYLKFAATVQSFGRTRRARECVDGFGPFMGAGDLLEKGSMTLVTFADPEAGGDIVRG